MKSKQHYVVAYALFRDNDILFGAAALALRTEGRRCHLHFDQVFLGGDAQGTDTKLPYHKPIRRSKDFRAHR